MGKTRRGPWRALRHRLRPALSRPLVAAARRAVPWLYRGHLGLVWATSRRDVEAGRVLTEACREHGGAIALLWHEELLLVPYVFARLGVRGRALVARGDAGDVLGATLPPLGHEAIRGAWSRRASRRDGAVLLRTLAALRGDDERVLAIAVDGTHGPRFQMKRGGVALAQRTGLPIFLVRTWSRRALRLGSWDRLAIPGPGNALRVRVRGPYFVARAGAGPAGRDELESERRRLERELAELAAESYRAFDQAVPGELAARLGESSSD